MARVEELRADWIHVTRAGHGMPWQGDIAGTLVSSWLKVAARSRRDPARAETDN